MCWELVSKRDESWVLHYVKSAYAVTDTPDEVRILCLTVVANRNAPQGPRAALATPEVAQRLVLCRHTRHSQVLLYIPFFTLVRTQILDTRRAALPDIQSDLYLVRSGTLLRFSCTCATAHCLQANFYIAFFVLTNALEDPTILGGKRIQLINTILEYSYGGLLLICFILSLGSRPRGSNKQYTLAFIGFAILTVYMVVRFTLFANWCSD